MVGEMGQGDAIEEVVGEGEKGERSRRRGVVVVLAVLERWRCEGRGLTSTSSSGARFSRGGSRLNKDHLVIVIRDILYEVGWWFYLPLLKLFLNTCTFGSHVVPKMGVLHHGLLDVFVKAEAVGS